MERIQLWSIDKSCDAVRAEPIQAAGNTETEQLLEDLLVSSPHLLEQGLNLIGRQVQCEGGVLDLLAIDRDGRITVYELKRGAVTREAVAQVIDYASELASLGTEQFARLVEEASGRLGIAKIDDFLDWYTQEYPDASEALSERPRMVLVGVGVDARARRMVNFLAEGGIELELLTFHAFRDQGRTFLARQVEMTRSPKHQRDATSVVRKQVNLEALRSKAAEYGLTTFLEQWQGYLQSKLTNAYCWPGKTALSFSLPERTTEGRPTLRAYVTLYVQGGPSPHLLLTFAPRAVTAAGPAVDAFCEAVPEAVRDPNSYTALEVPIRQDTHDRIRSAVDELLDEMVDGWKQLVEALEGA